MRIDPLAGGEVVEQRAIEAAVNSDVLDDGIVAQSGIAQPGREALVAAMGDLMIDEQTEPIGMGEGRPSPEASSSAKARAIPESPSWCS